MSIKSRRIRKPWPRDRDLSILLQDQKPRNNVKISKYVFRDSLIGINQIDHEKSENRDFETQVLNFKRRFLRNSNTR